MKKLIFILAVVMSACSGNNGVNEETSMAPEKDEKATMISKIDALESRVYDKTKSPIQSDLVELMNSYQEFGDTYPKDENAAEYYFKSAELAQSTGNSKKAVDLFQLVFDNYENYDKRATCLFMIAFNYHYFIKDLDKAKVTYEKVVELFPGTQEALDSAASIPLIGLSDEEIIKQFEKQNNLD